jgi:hypothetical protein
MPMTTDATLAAFLAAYRSGETDCLPYLSDYLEDQGDPQAAKVRDLIRWHALAEAHSGAGEDTDVWEARDRLRASAGVEGCRLWACLCVRRMPLHDGRRVDTRTLLVEPPPVATGWDACVEWAGALTLRLLQAAESPRVAVLRDLLNAISTAKRVGTDVETALRAREQREGVPAAAAREPQPPEDDAMALPLWHAFALCRLAYDAASAAGVTDQIASAYRARAKTHVAGLRVRELASTKALQERHKIRDLRAAVRDHAEVSAQMEREALDADLIHEATSSLIAFGHFMSREFKSPNHIQVVADALERVERGEIKRLVLNLPPRYGKSMLASQLFPSWYLGRHPDRDIICSANGQELADSFGRVVRNLMSSEELQRVFPGVHVADDSQAVNRFDVVDDRAGFRGRRGAYKGFGRNGRPTGTGAHLLLMDDLLVEREADSDAAIAECHRAIRQFRSRLAPGGSWVVINTRYRENDPVGYILSEYSDDGPWTVISLPRS